MKTLLAVVTSLLACSSYAGEVTGRVTLKGTPPPERVVDLSLYPALAAKHPNGLTTRHYQVGADGGLQSVLVYLRGDFEGRTFEPPRIPAVLDHVGGLFQPFVVGVQVGQPLQLRCADKTTCGFHVTPKQNREFNPSPIGQTVSTSFSIPEVPVRVKCDLHPWNYTYLGIFAHPFFTVTDKDGRLTIPYVPPGRYTLEIFHPRTGKSAREVIVSTGKIVTDFTVTAK